MEITQVIVIIIQITQIAQVIWVLCEQSFGYAFMGSHAGLQRKDQQISELRDVTNISSNIINYFCMQQLNENGNNQH